MDTTDHSSSRPGVLKVILKAGILAGFLDAAAASIQYLITSHGKSPVAVWKYVASGFFGKAAFGGGGEMVAAGLGFHFFNAILFSAFFYFLYSKIKWISNHIIIAGIIYGIFVWCVMNLVVVPLSNVPPYAFSFSKAIIAACILIVCVGIPVALVAHGHLHKKINGAVHSATGAGKD
jgi:hypothetical protein